MFPPLKASSTWPPLSRPALSRCPPELSGPSSVYSPVFCTWQCTVLMPARYLFLPTSLGMCLCRKGIALAFVACTEKLPCGSCRMDNSCSGPRVPLLCLGPELYPSLELYLSPGLHPSSVALLLCIRISLCKVVFLDIRGGTEPAEIVGMVHGEK